MKRSFESDNDFVFIVCCISKVVSPYGEFIVKKSSSQHKIKYEGYVSFSLIWMG